MSDQERSTQLKEALNNKFPFLEQNKDLYNATLFADELLKKMENEEQKLDTYLNLCTQMYDISKPLPPEDAYAFYRSYVINAKGSILEPMCGTGRFLLPLLAEGYDVDGFDASEHMLEALHAKAKQQGLKPIVWKAFAENLNRSQKYNLIFIPSGSFGLITDPVAVKRTLQVFFDHLTGDGILLFECETLKSASALDVWQETSCTRLDGKIIRLSTYATLVGNICTIIGKYDLVDNNSIIQVENETYKMRLYEPEEMTSLLNAAGFSKVKLIKAFHEKSLPDANDEVIVYECRKIS